MKHLSKNIKLGAVLNLSLLVATYFLCYYITPEDISGVCDECSAECSMSLFLGTSALMMQGIMGVLMFRSAKKMKKTHDTEGVAASLLVSILLSFIQMAVMFTTTPKVSCHEKFIQADLVKIKILEQQFTIGRIILILLVVFYIAMIAMATCRSTQLEKKTKEKAILFAE